MKVVYIAGPFRAPTAWGIECNIRRAEDLAFDVAHLGFMPLVPHANTRFFHGTLTDEFWLEGTIELLKRCDALITVDGWERSSGSRAEVEWCTRNDRPVFFDVEALAEWGDKCRAQ